MGARRARSRLSDGRLITRIWNGRGSNISRAQFEQMQDVNRAAWRKELIGHEELFIDLHDHLPPEMIYERELLICRM